MILSETKGTNQMNEVERLKSDLYDLLVKYNATISFECSACSDLHGVHDERIVVSVRSAHNRYEEQEAFSVDGYSLDKSDF